MQKVLDFLWISLNFVGIFSKLLRDKQTDKASYSILPLKSELMQITCYILNLFSFLFPQRPGSDLHVVLSQICAKEKQLETQDRGSEGPSQRLVLIRQTKSNPLRDYVCLFIGRSISGFSRHTPVSRLVCLACRPSVHPFFCLPVLPSIHMFLNNLKSRMFWTIKKSKFYTIIGWVSTVCQLCV